MKTLAERVKWARSKRGLTGAELDEVADLSCGHTSMIECGRRETPSIVTISKLARALNVDVAWLINGGKRPEIAKAG